MIGIPRFTSASASASALTIAGRISRTLERSPRGMHTTAAAGSDDGAMKMMSPCEAGTFGEYVHGMGMWVGVGMRWDEVGWRLRWGW